MSDDFQQRGGSPWGTPPGGSGNGNGSKQTINTCLLEYRCLVLQSCHLQIENQVCIVGVDEGG